VSAYKQVADKYSLPLAPVALAWVASQPGVCSTLIGVSSAQQLRENVQALNLAPMAQELLEDIDAVRRRYVDPAKGVHTVMDPNTEYVDFAKLPWGAKDQDVDPQLDLLISRM
jgi:predicted aldo/keto reductase-like oxidoreductase